MISCITSCSWWWTSCNHPSVGIAILTIFIGYILFEIGFFFHYRRNLIPFANQVCLTSPPAPYRDYRTAAERSKLLSRIIDRLEAHHQLTKTTQNEVSASEVIYNFIESWFHKKEANSNDTKYARFSEQLDMTTLGVGLCPPLSLSSYSFERTSSVTDDDGFTSSSNDSLPQLANNKNGKDNIGRLCRDNMDEFLSWAFFGVDCATVESDTNMREALDQFYTILQSKAGLQFELGRNSHFTPRWFTFENVQSLYRPFGVYAAVALLQFTANCVLYIIGFRQYTCEKGLRYWHRPATMQKQQDYPFLFFHGIAPGGHAPYLPMVLLGLLRGDRSCHRDIFFFENKPITYSLCFEALSEEDTVHGVVEAVHQHLDSDRANNLMLCGHSFGSCQLTWMINSPQLKNRVHSMILLDPVSIILHEPDVVVNFLYTRSPDYEDSYHEKPDSLIGRFGRFVNETKIHLVASSELFVEFYLRRNFAWYNSELWLEDIPLDVKVLVCLAKNDEITNAKKIERELSRLAKSRNNIQTISWDEVGHAHCISNSDRWSEICDSVIKMEQ